MSSRKVTTVALALSFLCGQASYAAEPVLVAIGSVSGSYEDFATQTAGSLGNNVPGNRLGGLGSGLTYLGGDWFLALPDRGPNAVAYNRRPRNTSTKHTKLSATGTKQTKQGMVCVREFRAVLFS
jgi:hypothetical protein